MRYGTDIREFTIAKGHCPECETFSLKRQGGLPVCQNCEWTGWPDEDEYPEDHSPFCHKSCDHPCHDAYDKMKDAYDKMKDDDA